MWQAIAGPAWLNADNLFFTNAIGDHLYHITLNDICKKAGKAIGREDLHLHILRHSYATRSIAAGEDIWLFRRIWGIIQQLLLWMCMRITLTNHERDPQIDCRDLLKALTLKKPNCGMVVVY
jgi:integrase